MMENQCHSGRLSTRRNSSIDDASKLNRLFELCDENVAKVIHPCAMMEPSFGYRRVWGLLKMGFGNDYRITASWKDKVAKGSPLKTGEDIQDLADDMRSCIKTLRAMGRLHEIDSSSKIVEILARLPETIEQRWGTQAVSYLERNGDYPGIEEFAAFVDIVAREKCDPVYGGVNKRKSTTNTRKCKEQ